MNEREEHAAELAAWVWTTDDEDLRRSSSRVKRNLRHRVLNGNYVRELAAGAWLRVADLASKLCAERMKRGNEDAPFIELNSGGKYGHDRKTRKLTAGFLAEHYNKHLEQVQEEVDDGHADGDI
mgnify:FL=1